MEIRVQNLSMPVGLLRVAANSADAICVVTFEPERFVSWCASVDTESIVDAPFDHPIIEQLDRYFSGDLQQFDLEIDERGTPFQRQVWQALRSIDYGETISYAELAIRLENRDAVRAVGTANGQNPLALLNPCHRVIGSDGALRGYAGGVEKKRALLELERASCVAQTELF